MKKQTKMKNMASEPLISIAIQIMWTAVKTAPVIDDDNTKFDINNWIKPPLKNTEKVPII